jgi:hypothetical protein
MTQATPFDAQRLGIQPDHNKYLEFYGPFDAERINTSRASHNRGRDRIPKYPSPSFASTFRLETRQERVTPLATWSTNSGMRRRQKDIRSATIHALVVSQF